MSISTTKLLVISDSHGNLSHLQAVIDKEYPFEYIIHCGDGINDLHRVSLPSDIVILCVVGNVDSWNGEHQEKLIIKKIAGKRLMITHGDLFHAQNGFNALIQKGKSEAADTILFGHTHKNYIQCEDPVLFNPGALLKGEYGIALLGEKEQYIHKGFE